MFKRILIANRGEIAVRIIRACRDLGVSPAVVYSEADRDSLAVKLADQAHCIGPPPAGESYLHIDRLLEAAALLGAEAVHPGYGFLAENADFARACQDKGLEFIGPPADAIELMGDKIASREAVGRAGVPVVPGSPGALRDVGQAVAVAAQIGYPVMIKASAGGGGKGLRLAGGEEDVRSLFKTAQGEARASFGDATLYLEKYIPRPRHIEVQLLGDRQGRLIHLGERECSIQRRHQKLVEECPSPRVTPRFRELLGEAAIRVARAVDYYNAGTIEFLVDDSVDRETPPFYFLEMNTRLQVEHPVTEMVTGVDLVVEQIRIAAGLPLGIAQEDLSWRGAAIECRIYAEDPAHNFVPSPGQIFDLYEPSGPGIRNDSGVGTGYRIPVEYDPLISKLVAHGANRSAAISRMRRALLEYKIAGVRTTIPFFEQLLAHPEFQAGRLHTHFIEQHDLLKVDQPTDEILPAVAAALEGLLETAPIQPATPSRAGGWKDWSRFKRRYTR